MENKTKESIDKMKELSKKVEYFNNEIINNPDLPQEIKEALSKIRAHSKQKWEEYEKYLEENKHKKIIGYNPETFEPIFEDKK